MPSRSVPTPEVIFPLRVDCNGYRPVYKLGNEAGNCSFGCKFCGVGKSPRVSSADNIAAFDALHAKHLSEIDGPYHPAVFNRGNVTDIKAFSAATLNYILDRFERDRRVSYVSLNSRERTATFDVLDRLTARNFPFPIHFIFGQESFGQSAPRILGKDNRGELERFIDKLKYYNQKYTPGEKGKGYLFGLDVNMVFLPELYLAADEARIGHEARIAQGFTDDISELLRRIDPFVPVEINIHPYYEVESLPYDKADLLMLLEILPRLGAIVEEHNRNNPMNRTHLFLGVVFLPYDKSDSSSMDRERIKPLEAAIDRFNRGL